MSIVDRIGLRWILSLLGISNGLLILNHVSSGYGNDAEKKLNEEILECRDGRKRRDGPSYWQIFAEFYYRDVSAPEYCRYYSRNNHAFKMHGKTCLKSNGRWEIK